MARAAFAMNLELYLALRLEWGAAFGATFGPVFSTALDYAFDLVFFTGFGCVFRTLFQAALGSLFGTTFIWLTLSFRAVFEIMIKAVCGGKAFDRNSVFALPFAPILALPFALCLE